MMSLERVLMGGALLLLLGNAHALDGKKIFTEGGSQPGAMPCVACHGADGLGLAAAGFPRLAGLSAEYVRKQLTDFSSGARSNPVMQPLAKALTDAEIAAVSQALAAMPYPLPVTVFRSEMPTSAAQKLALQGAWERQIPACVSCHGPAGVGVGDAFPPLAGQPAAYLAAQLTAWQSGTRRNDPNDLMGHIAKSLTPEEVQGIAQYFASLNLEAKP
ncbi:c-type cytochrome [Pseudomonas costantinii]|uniref:Cytochrome C n=1 Tax=Pseudomonas costantinii TaxID=168469 RepID=A0A1S2V2U5_9PSED|nr:c-type cytochrome [Pseudomonas costantinii]NVZ22550.1 c-type cytochrome [Pseudomonas costantinii]OIN53071.1 cytochrome C [Pseudomonas costantinii]SED23908.1 Cytochrome c553 [Pseudomonas costantinii]